MIPIYHTTTVISTQILISLKPVIPDYKVIQVMFVILKKFHSQQQRVNTDKLISLFSAMLYFLHRLFTNRHTWSKNLRNRNPPALRHPTKTSRENRFSGDCRRTICVEKIFNTIEAVDTLHEERNDRF